MPKSLRPVVKKTGAGGSQAEVGLQEEPDAGRAVQRRRVGEEGGWWFLQDENDQKRMNRLLMEQHKMFYKGLSQADIYWEYLQEAKAREAELTKNAAALQSIIKLKDSVIQSKDALLRRLKAEIARGKCAAPMPPYPSTRRPSEVTL
jgi:hypothetical protein